MSDPSPADQWAPTELGVLSQKTTGSSSQGSAAQAPSPDEAQLEKQKGYESGYAEGLAAGQAQAATLVKHMEALLHSMAAPFAETDAVLLRELLDLTERVARAVIRRELESGVDIEQVLADALAALGSVSSPVQLTLNPEDAALCRELGLLPNERFELQTNPAFERGGLQLRAGHSFVDASVESRIEMALFTLRAEAGLPSENGLESSGSSRPPAPGADDGVSDA